MKKRKKSPSLIARPPPPPPTTVIACISCMTALSCLGRIVMDRISSKNEICWLEFQILHVSHPHLATHRILVWRCIAGTSLFWRKKIIIWTNLDIAWKYLIIFLATFCNQILNEQLVCLTFMCRYQYIFTHQRQTSTNHTGISYDVHAYI